MSYTRTFSSLGCPELSLGEALALAARHGLPAIELRSLSGTVDLVALFTQTHGTPEHLAAHVKSAPAGIVSLDTSFHLIGDNNEARRREFLEFLPWAEALGVRWLRVFDGGNAPTEAQLAEAAATVRWWRDLRVPAESIPGQQDDADTRHWEVPVPANGKTELTVTFLTPW